MDPTRPDVTACIPAYRSGDFIESTLLALRRQTYANFRALISIDGPDEATEAVCRRTAADDPRFEVIVQRDRLGWLGNTNALFDRVVTDFFFILPHDDFIAETYIEELRRAAIAYPQALNVYCDMERHGRRADVRSTPGLDGPFLTRINSLFSATTEAVAWRGLTRSSVLSAGYRMRSNDFDSYNSHLLWVLTLLCLGPFHHVPKPLYRQWERKDERSVTTGWRAWSAERRYAAMAEHTVQCIETVSTVGEADPGDRQSIILLLLLRLLAYPRGLDPFKSGQWPGIDRTLIRTAELLGRLYGLDFMPEATIQRLRAADDLQRWMAKVRLADANEALAADDLAAAAVALDHALAFDPQSGDALRRKAILLRRQGRLPEAVSAIGRARQLLPENAHVALEQATVLEAAGDLEGAFAAARAALALDPGLAGAHYRMSVLLARRGAASDALAAAARAVEADPAHPKFRKHQEALRRQLTAAAPPGPIA